MAFDRVSFLRKAMEMNNYTSKQVAHICGVSEQDVETWLKPNEYVIPKDKLVKLVSLPQLMVMNKLTDSDIARLAGMPVSYVPLWIDGSLEVPSFVKLKALTYGG